MEDWVLVGRIAGTVAGGLPSMDDGRSGEMGWFEAVKVDDSGTRSLEAAKAI
jgi:hypothetical protein